VGDMKYTLKNRPKWIADPTTNEQEAERWFEGFEKELRDNLDVPSTTPYIQGWNDAIKEILGE